MGRQGSRECQQVPTWDGFLRILLAGKEETACSSGTVCKDITDYTKHKQKNKKLMGLID